MSDQGQWQVVGNAAEVYERALVPAVFAPWAPMVVALGDPKPGERVLDVACGTGVVARLASQRVGPTGTVVGLDAARFRDVAIRPVSGTVRFPSASRFVEDQVAGSPLAGHVAKVSDEARAALAGEIGDTLGPYLSGGGLAFPIEAHLASARR